LPNFDLINNSISEPPVWTLNNRHPINKWIKNPNPNVNKYTNPNMEELILEPEVIHDVDVRTSSQPQPQAHTSMSSFSYDLSYQSLFDPYMIPPQGGSMQKYFGYITQSIYYLNFNQQAFQLRVNDEFTNIHNAISNIQ
jgi:hypothetical protein